MSFLRSVFSVGGLTILSRLTGYCRDFLIVQLIGINILSDALAIAIKFPAFFRRLFAEGAFHVSFLPLFTESKRNHHFAGMILSLLILMVGTCVVIIEWKFQWLSQYIFQGLSKKPETLALVIDLGRITFPYILFISLASFFASILNAYGRFSFAAGTHAIGNIVVILCVGLLSLYSKNYGRIFAWAILISGVAQFLCVAGACWVYGYRIIPRMLYLTPLVKRFLRNFGPGILSVGVVQLNILISLYLASSLPSGGISYLSYADRLNQLPLSIIGVSLSSVLLPLLSSQLRSHNIMGANRTQNYALQFAGFVTLPSMMFLISLAFPCICILFGHGKLRPFQVGEIAKTLTAYSIGIPAYVLIKILNARFFAHGQTRIPLMASALGVAVDVAMSFAFIGSYQHIGLALALSFSAWATVVFLAIMMCHHYNWGFSPSLRSSLTKITLSCGIVGAILKLFQFYLPPFDTLALGSQVGLFVFLLFMGIILLAGFFKAFRLMSRRQLKIIWRSLRRNHVVES